MSKTQSIYLQNPIWVRGMEGQRKGGTERLRDKGMEGQGNGGTGKWRDRKTEGKGKWRDREMERQGNGEREMGEKEMHYSSKQPRIQM